MSGHTARPVAVLVGPPGAGKSTVATAVADLLGVPARDTDADIVASTGKSVAEIFVDDGEPAFRELERAAVITALVGFNGVLAVGGGSVMDPRTEADLGSHTVVFLDVGLADASRRIGFDASRPLLIGNPRAQWKRQMDARRSVYERVADHVVTTSGRTAADVAAEVAALLATDRSARHS